MVANLNTMRLSDIYYGITFSSRQERGRLLKSQPIGSWNIMKIGSIFDVQNLMRLHFAVRKLAKHDISLVSVKALIKNCAI